MHTTLLSKTSNKPESGFNPGLIFSTLKNYNLETIICVLIFSGIILLNKEFTHINYRQVYIVEALMMICLVTVFIRHALSGNLQSILTQVILKRLYPLVLLLALAAFTLLTSLDNGFLALKQSFILFYGLFVILFIFSFNQKRELKDFLLFSLVIFSFTIILKLLINLVIGNTYAHEPWRVVHDEVDVIFASVAILGLFVFRKEFCQQHKWLYAALIIINLSILTLTMKRTAFIGLFIALIYCAFQLRWFAAFKLRHLGYAVLALVIAFVFSLVFTNVYSQVEQIVRSKLDVLNEGNSAWRIMAWKQAIAKFQDNPIFGSGYGHRILDTSLWSVDTMDPHNSYLAILVYNGLSGFMVLISLVALAFINYKKILASHQNIETKKLTIWCAAALIFMVIFPCFNVSLENQRQSIFFWFFISASFFLNPQILSVINIDDRITNKRLSVAGVIGGLMVLVYLALLVSPGNFIKAHDIYNPKNNGQVPLLEKHDEEAQLFYVSNNGLTLTLKGSETEKYAYLIWVITGEFIERFNKKNASYVIEIAFKDVIDSSIILHFNKRMGGHIAMENITPETNKFTFALDKAMDYKELDIYSMSLLIPHHITHRMLNIQSVRIVAK